jgi:tetratricopeptide (TPR) repeat protein
MSVETFTHNLRCLMRTLRDSLRILRCLIQFQPRTAAYYINQGIDCQQRGELEKARACYERAMRIEPQCVSAYINPEALADYNHAIYIDPKTAIAYHNRGLVSKMLGNLNAALADYRMAIQIAPDNPVTYNNRANVYAENGQFEKALADYDRALQLDPHYGDAYDNRGYIRAKLGDAEGAAADYSRAKDFTSDSTTTSIQGPISARQS